MNDKYLVEVLNRFERLKEYSHSFIYNNDIPENEIQYLKSILKNLELEMEKGKERYIKYLKEYESIRDSKANTGMFNAEYDDKDDPYNERDQVDDYNSQLVKILGQQLDEFEKDLRMYNQAYFGGLDVKVNGKELKLYIGKNGLVDESNRVLVTDWRAPISSVFYSNTYNKSVDIEINDINTKIDVKSKRYYDINRGSLMSIYNPKSGNRVADMYLEKELANKKSSKLSDIISTIQENQNEIIRSPINIPMIIQGVAGSGKSTILFHRLAYLIYSFKEKFRSDNSLLIVPNTVFKKYTEDIIPSLGLLGLDVDTITSWYRRYMSLPNNFVITEINYEYSEEVSKINMQLDKLIRSYIDSVLGQVYESIPEIKGFIENYKDKTLGNSSIPYKERVEMLLEDAVLDYVSITFPNANDQKKDGKIDGTTEKINKIIGSKLDLINIYSYIISNLEGIDSKHINLHKKQGVIKYVSDIENYKVEETTIGNTPYYLTRMDYSLMMLLYISFFGIYDKYDFIAMDESQEISLLDLYILIQVVKANNLILAGDISQVLNNKLNTSWDLIVKGLNEYTNKETKLFSLNESYRCTKEIVDVVNNLSVKFGKDRINAHIGIEDSYKHSSNLTKSIEDSMHESYSNIAVVVKDEDSMEKIKTILKQSDLLEMFTNSWGQDENIGLWLLTTKEARGLEFDCVILYDFDIDNIKTVDQYNSIYVAMTRAMKKLIVIK